MANAVFAWENRADAGAVTVSASAAPASLPAGNMLRPIVREFWRSASTVGWMQVDFGTDVPIRLLAFAQPTDGPVMAASDTVRHVLYSDAGGITTEGIILNTGYVPCGVQPLRGVHAHLLEVEVMARYWRCTFSATSLAGVGGIDVGRLWAGPAWQPEVNFSYGAEWGWEDLGSVVRGERTGVPYAAHGGRLRSRTLPWEAMRAADKARADAFIATVGTTRQWVLWADPADPAEVMFALLAGMPRGVQRYFNADALTFSALEHP